MYVLNQPKRSLSIFTTRDRCSGISYLNHGDPVLDAVFIAFAIHDTRAASAPQKHIAVVSGGSLLQASDLLLRSDVMCSDQGIEQLDTGMLHRHGWLQRMTRPRLGQ